ncbi:MAG: Coenzyme F420 hydrogenase/dehydrogenase, beta subunit C-terminal domain [Bacteroidales bacterium]|nr:Coenzyme F420 hydrogenase/dehydrogenase, beta subunit C-terminal domain [Bacteroidales bacterium]
MTVALKEKRNCCGCTACETICPHDAIEMQADSLGFFYPMVDSEKCVDCGICERVCQFNDNYYRSSNDGSKHVYAMRSSSSDDLLKSQSGAAFYSIAKSLIADGYYVCGAGFDKDFTAKHKIVNDITDLQELRGSKYVQSNLQGIYIQIKNLLNDSGKVLFAGTPCQVSGLLSVLSETQKQSLLSIDIICHSVPSPRAWQMYVKWVEKKYDKKVLRVNYRDKRFGWKSCRETFYFDDGSEISRDSFRHFMMSASHFATRTSCANCPFTNMKRPGDITVGDFWGWEKFHEEFNDNQGLSLVLVNSPKGESVINSVLGKMSSVESNIDECHQPQLKHPITIDFSAQKRFIDLMEKGDFNKIMKVFADEGMKYKLARLKKRILNRRNR